MTTFRLKLKLIKDGVKEHRCEGCQLTKWKNESIPLELHHVDGNRKNNELENLKLFCCNCHALTPNYRARKKQKKGHYVTDEELIISIESSYTRREALLKCGLVGYGGNYYRINDLIEKRGIHFLQSKIYEEQQKRIETIRSRYSSVGNVFKIKIKWPSNEEMISLLSNNPISEVARKLKVSASSVKKHALRNGIDVKKINIWSRRHDPKMVGVEGIEPPMFPK